MHALRHSFLSLAATTMEMPDATPTGIAGHASPAVPMRLYARDRRDQERVNETCWPGRPPPASASSSTLPQPLT
jgi:hypothetical protein